MSATTVYGCDWCKTIVPKGRDDKPMYVSKVTISELRTITLQSVTEEICADCRKALQALREGRYRRG